MRPQCRGWHPTCSSQRRWVPALITRLVLIRRHDGIWWWCTFSQLFLLLSGPIDLTQPLCWRQQMLSRLPFFIKLKCIAHYRCCYSGAMLKISTSGHFQVCLLPDLLCSFLQDPGDLDKIPQVRVDVGTEKVIRIFMSHMCSETTAGFGSEDTFQYMHAAISEK